MHSFTTITIILFWSQWSNLIDFCRRNFLKFSKQHLPIESILFHETHLSEFMPSCEAVTEPCGYLNYDGAIYLLNPHNRHHSLNSLCFISGNTLFRSQTRRSVVHKFGWHPPWKVVDGYKRLKGDQCRLVGDLGVIVHPGIPASCTEMPVPSQVMEGDQGS